MCSCADLLIADHRTAAITGLHRSLITRLYRSPKFSTFVPPKKISHTMKHFLLFLIFLSFFSLSNSSKAQCDPGFVEVFVIAYSYDVWGEETYYELVPSGNGCGNGTLVSGSSEEVGCDGSGPSGENGIQDFGFEISGPLCLPEGEFF